MIRSSERMVLDTGVLMDILDGNNESLYNKIIHNSVDTYISRISLTELTYVVCRKIGGESGRRVINNLLASNLVKVVSQEEVHNLAAEFKCRYSISIGDCYSLGLAKLMEVPVYFRPEKEIILILEKLRGECDVVVTK